jgi:aminomethyltransferase
MCYPDGGIVDDLLVYRFEQHLMLVVNASNIDKDLQWIREHVEGDVQVENESETTALIAVQGPKSEAFLQRCTDVDLARIGYYHFTTGYLAGVEMVISRTGYTGEAGFELYSTAAEAPLVWRKLLDTGQSDGLKLVGLGARDTLRLEAGYMLYGNDIDATTSPLEAGLSWTVKFGPSDFVGRAVLENQKTEGLTRRMVAIDMKDRGIPRQHNPVTLGDETIGELTSGTFSPTFGRGIGLGYVRSDRSKVGTDVAIQVRQIRHPAQIVRKPMYKREDS